MEPKKLYGIVQRIVLSELAKLGETYVPVNSSNRHCHLSREDVDKLFGVGYELTPTKELVQPGQYAAAEKVVLVTDKGTLSLRVVGPIRKETQVELSMTDAVKVGMKLPIRMSGDLAGSPGCTLANGEKRITIPKGVIIAARHLHLAPEEAEAFHVKDGDIVSLLVEGQRETVLNNVIVRSGKAHLMEAHIDRDEANACGLQDGQLCRVILPECREPQTKPRAIEPTASQLKTFVSQNKSADATPSPPKPEKNKIMDLSNDPHCLIGEDTVLTAVRDGMTIIRYGKGAILTPLARDMASAKGIILAEKPD